MNTAYESCHNLVVSVVLQEAIYYKRVQKKYGTGQFDRNIKTCYL